MNIKDEEKVIEVLKEMGAKSVKFTSFENESLSFEFNGKKVIMRSYPVNTVESRFDGGVFE